MGAVAAVGDTWGISGPTFLGLYAALAVIAAVGTVSARRRLARGVVTTPVPRLGSQPDDVAYLHGGPELTVLAALTAMHAAGRITTSGRHRIQAVGSVDSGVSELARAIHWSARHPVRRTALPGEPSVREALARIERRLTDAGLLLSAEQRRGIRQTGWMLWFVVAVGAIRAVAGATADQPIGFLLAMMGTVAMGALVVSFTAPRRTSRGTAELERLRTAHAGLSPQLRPDQRVYGAAGAALGVAVFGASALWAADPAFATELGAQRRELIGDNGGGGVGAGCGSGGGGGCGGGGCGG